MVRFGTMSPEGVDLMPCVLWTLDNSPATANSPVALLTCSVLVLGADWLMVLIKRAGQMANAQ